MGEEVVRSIPVRKSRSGNLVVRKSRSGNLVVRKSRYADKKVETPIGYVDVLSYRVAHSISKTNKIEAIEVRVNIKRLANAVRLGPSLPVGMDSAI